MKGVIIIIVFALDVVVILINISALVLLTYSKKNNLRGSQRILLIALCETELVYSATDLVGYVFYVLNVREGLIALLSSNSTSVTFFYVTIMMLIPIDRFLEIHLNIKYNIHWSPNKTKIVLTAALALCILLFIPLSLVKLQKVYSLQKILVFYINPLLQLIFIIVASFSYFYIIKQGLRHRRNIRTLEQQLKKKKNTAARYMPVSNRFKIILPSLIIITFILFMIGSNVIRILLSLNVISKVGSYVAYIFIPAGFVADPVIYIFSLKSMRQAIKRVTRRRRNSVRSFHPSYC